MQVKLLCLVRKCAMVSHTSSFVLLGNAVDNVINNFIIKDFISPTCISSAINHKDNFYVSAHLLTAMIRMHFSIYYLLVNILELFYTFCLVFFLFVLTCLSVVTLFSYFPSCFQYHYFSCFFTYVHLSLLPLLSPPHFVPPLSLSLASL